MLIKHPFITKLAKGREYLEQLIEQHIEEVEKFRCDKEEYLNSKENQDNENNNLQENKEYNLNYIESLSNIQNTYSVNIDNKKSSNGIIDFENKEKYLDHFNYNNNSDVIKNNGKEEYNSNIAYKSINYDFSNIDNNQNINEDIDDNKYVIISKEKELKNLSANNFINDEKKNNNYFNSIKESTNIFNNNTNNTNISNNIQKNISILSDNKSNNLSEFDYTFKKNLLENKFELDKNINNNFSPLSNKNNISSDKFNNSLNNKNRKKIGGTIKRKMLIYNNSNSNGGAISKRDENINESDDDDKIRPINHCILNANYENNKLENTYDDIRLTNLNNNLENKTENKKIIKKNIKIPPLNLVGIFNNDNNYKSSDLNTIDSPTHISSFSLCKIHQKYFQ